MVIELEVRLGKMGIVEGRQETVPMVIEVRGSKPSDLPTAVLIAIDVSLSMDGAKIFRAKEAALRILRELEEFDLVSVYGFHRKAFRVVQLAKKGDGKEIERSIVDLKLGGGTNIYEVLKLMAEDAEKLGKEMRVGGVKAVLITDGIPTAGPRSENAIVAAARELGKYVSTAMVVGVGEEYNEKLLLKIAAALNGVFNHVSDPDDLVKDIPRFLAKRMRLSAKNVRIVVKTAQGVELKVVGREVKPVDGGVEVVVGDVHYGEKIVIPCELHVPPQPRGPRILASVFAKYVDLLKDEEVSTSARSIEIVAVPPEMESELRVDEKVLAEVTTARVAEHLKTIALEKGIAKETLKSLEELLAATMRLGVEELYRKTIDVREKLYEGKEAEASKELLSVVSKILSGRYEE